MKHNTYKHTTTICIPAYNEEGNLLHLLTDISAQTQKTFKITKILVISDGSTDATVAIAKSFHSNHTIEVVALPNRQGKAAVQNYAFSHTHTDSLVVLDADVRLYDQLFVEKLLKPIISGSAGLTSAQVMEIPPTNTFQAILEASMLLKKELFAEFKVGDNVHTCHGRARGFSKSLYSQLQFPVSASEDAYSYLYCKRTQLQYVYAHNAHVYYTLPQTFSDHLHQSLRYFDHDAQIGSYFPLETVQREYYLPFGLAAKHLFATIAKKPGYILGYAAVVFACKMYSLFSRDHLHLWKVAVSSKRTQ